MNSDQTERFLSTLKDFQRDTVDYAFARMYEQTPPATRFLIADEVGLGKTKVAAGIVARAADLLMLTDKERRVDVVYICSNSAIARQNIKRLNVTGKPTHDLPDRITLLPKYTKRIRANGDRVNFIAFSPGTSFNLRSSGGRAEERALLYHLIPADWRDADRKGTVSLLMGEMRRDRFQYQIDTINPLEHVDEALTVEFQNQLSKEAAAADASAPSVHQRFLELASQLGGRSGNGLTDDERSRRATIVGELRSTLAAVCVHSLEPDLVILDEFQRFSDVLHGEDEASQLARRLFEYRDERYEHGAVRVLLLSATPYRMFSTADEVAADGHYKDLIQTVAFLQQDAAATARFKEALESYEQGLHRLPVDGGEHLRAAKDSLQRSLSQVMVRTERLGATSDRSGMLREVAAKHASLTEGDVASYLEVQQLARSLGVADVVEYWKSAPYLLNFMDDYDLKRRLTERIEVHAKGETELHAPMGGSGVLLSKADIENYCRIDPGNTRLRDLLHDMVDSGAWRLLWVPPAWNYYRPEGEFAEPRLQRFTKRLIFSSWQVVPKVVASIVTYEAERRMLSIRDQGEAGAQTPDARKRRRGLLRLSVADGRPTGMPALALLYPSFTLASACDPQPLAHTDNGVLPSLTEVLAQAETTIVEHLREVVASTSNSGEADERWYWAAPLLLDLRTHPGAQAAWFDQNDLAGVWRVAPPFSPDDDEAEREERDMDAAWDSHVEAARSVLKNPESLGRVPEDLPAVLALFSVAGPGVLALRALARVTGGLDKCTEKALRNRAGQIAEGFRSLFNQPEVADMVRGEEPYWRRVLEYCARGGLQAVLDEYAHVLVDHLGVSGRPIEEIAKDLSQAVSAALTLRTATLFADEVRAVEGGSLELRKREMSFRTRFAVRFGGRSQEAAQVIAREADVQKAFNSPFWPFVLCSTSVGQEGLDFHLYCHAVMHWNLPSNPVDLEQREGRVHRFKGHAVRKNVAREFARKPLPGELGPHPDRWRTLFEAARSSRKGNVSDLVPFWVFATKDGDRIERHIPMIPLSKDVARAETLRRSLALYRMAFGQSRQDDLIAYLQRHLKPEHIPDVVKELQISLAPTPSANRAMSGRNQDPGDLGESAESSESARPAIGMSALESVLDSFAGLRKRVPKRTVVDYARLLDDFAAVSRSVSSEA